MNLEFKYTGIRNYWISENGDILNKDNGKTLKPMITKDGYSRIELKIEKGVPKKFYIHRLVYQSFIGELDSGLVIDHIDGDRSNNNYRNLRQVTQKKNIENALINGDFGQNNNKTIRVLNTETNTIKDYKSVKMFLIEIEAPKYIISNGAFSQIRKLKRYDKYQLVKQPKSF
ncbi:MAG: HNH endonuclease signature motif containing protein [Sarcina sp.]